MLEDGVGTDFAGNKLDTSILFSANQHINTKRKYFEYLVGSFKNVGCIRRGPESLRSVNSSKNPGARQAMAAMTRATTPHTLAQR